MGAWLHFPQRRSAILLVIIMATVLGCGLHMSLCNGLSCHEMMPDLWDFEHWPWWQESNGMLSYLLYREFWLSAPERLQHGELMVRLPIIVLAQLCLYLTYKLGNVLAQEAGSRCPWGLYGCFMLAVNCSFLAHSFHRRFYMLNMVMVLVATLLLIKACHQRTWSCLLVYMLAIWGCISTMLLSSLLLVPHLVYYVLSAPRSRQALKQGAVVALGCLALFGFLVVTDPGGFARFNYRSENSCFALFFCLGNMGAATCHPPVPAYEMNPPVLPTGEFAAWVITFVSAIAFVVVVWQLYKSRQGLQRSPAWLCPLILVWIVSFYDVFTTFVKIISLPPNYSWSLPFWALVMGQAISYRRWLRYLMLVAIIVAVPYTHTTLWVNDWSYKELVVTLAHQRHSLEPVVATSTNNIRYYLGWEIGNSRFVASDCYRDVARAWQREDIPLEVSPFAVYRTLGQVQRLRRNKPQRLWLLIDGDCMSVQEHTLFCLCALRQIQGLDFTRTSERPLEYPADRVGYPAELFCVTMLPCVDKEPVLRRPAPTPLRGHSALKYLQRCRVISLL